MSDAYLSERRPSAGPNPLPAAGPADVPGAARPGVDPSGTDRAETDRVYADEPAGTTAVGHLVGSVADERSAADDAEPAPIEIFSGPIDITGDSKSASDRSPEPASRRKKLVLGLALVVALAGAAGMGSVGWRIADQKDARLETPPEVAGLVRDDSERARTTADYLRTGFAADINLDESIGAVYTDPVSAERSVLIFGGTTLIWQPERDLDRLFELVADDEGAVTDVREVPAGNLGGLMKCGTTKTEEGDLAVCGWSDHGSAVLAMFPGRTVDEAASLLRTIREAIQTRS